MDVYLKSKYSNKDGKISEDFIKANSAAIENELQENNAVYLHFGVDEDHINILCDDHEMRLRIMDMLLDHPYVLVIEGERRRMFNLDSSEEDKAWFKKH